MKAIVNGKIITPDGIRSGVLLYEDGIIKGIAETVPEGAEVLDALGNYVSPGFIDLHIHGAGGGDFLDCTPEAYLAVARTCAMHGVTTIFPSLTTSSSDEFYRSMEAYREALKLNENGCRLDGIHVEGPYFNPEKAGAQDRRFLREPEPGEYLEMLERCPEIARWSIAPDVSGAREFIEEMTRRGIVTSIAHTNATFEQCEMAYNAGSRLMTHFYACMSTLHKTGLFRYAGAVEYGYYQDGIDVEIIADGFHVQPAILRTVLKIKGPSRIALVTDSMRAAGMPEGPSFFGSEAGGQPVLVEGGIAYLMDKSGLASSVATYDTLLRIMLRDTSCGIEDAVRMSSANPARIMKIDGRTGSIEPGKQADLTIFDEGINIKATIVGGKTVYSV